VEDDRTISNPFYDLFCPVGIRLMCGMACSADAPSTTGTAPGSLASPFVVFLVLPTRLNADPDPEQKYHIP
jgi:hypothetical protein